MFKVSFITAMLMGCIALSTQSASANSPVWQTWQPVYTPEPYAQPYQEPRRMYAPARQGNPVYRQAAYSADNVAGNALDCGLAQALDLPDNCIKKNASTRQGLISLSNYLQRLPRMEKVAPMWAQVSNAALLETIRALLAWHDGIDGGSLQERFELRPLRSWADAARAEYTGYFTPVLEVQDHPDAVFRTPIYRKPDSNWLTHLSHAAIANNALDGRGLEIAWTNDVVNLFYAQVQGSGIARYPDGREMVLKYAADNGQAFRSIASYIRAHGITLPNYGNDGVRQWLRNHPERIREVLTANPRYVFFTLSSSVPNTASGTGVIPGYTIAVDHKYIPLGAVLLAEVPRIDRNGNEVGQDWRLLFAQDKGIDIKGAGRLDLYTGVGKSAEHIAHDITGFRKAYMLIRKSGYGRGTNVAGR